jgi:phage shock protein C
MGELHRSNTNKWFAGVCGGLGERVGIDPTIIRLIAVLLTLCTGFLIGFLIYFIWMLVVSEDTKASRVQNWPHLYRGPKRVLGGVIGGLSEFTGVSCVLLRIIYLLASIITVFIPLGLLYLICWVIIPARPYSSDIEIEK